MSFMSFIDATNVVRHGLSAADKVKPYVGEAAKAILHGNKVALPHFIKPALIESPCFIQTSLAEEPIINDILKNLYNVYIGYILCALQMNDLVSGGRRVRDIIETVSTEGFKPYVDATLLAYGLQGTVENIIHAKTGTVPGHPDVAISYEEKYKDFVTEPHPSDPNSFIIKTDNRGRAIPKDKHQHVGANSTMSPDKANNVPISSGRQIELSFANGENDPIILTVNVKFNPRLVPEPVIEYIISQDVTDSIMRRWLQYRSGEIRFFKDFIFEVDKRVRLMDALKQDKTNALGDMLIHKNKNTLKRLKAVATTSTQSQNMANSVLIMDEATVARETKKIGFSFDRLSDRKRFFENTFNLFIVLVDNRYSRVTIYTNGIDQSVSYSFNELKASSATDKMSIKDIMEYLAKSQMPKF